MFQPIPGSEPRVGSHAYADNKTFIAGCRRPSPPKTTKANLSSTSETHARASDWVEVDRDRQSDIGRPFVPTCIAARTSSPPRSTSLWFPPLPGHARLSEPTLRVPKQSTASRSEPCNHRSCTASEPPLWFRARQPAQDAARLMEQRVVLHSGLRVMIEQAYRPWCRRRPESIASRRGTFATCSPRRSIAARAALADHLSSGRPRTTRLHVLCTESPACLRDRAR